MTVDSGATGVVAYQDGSAFVLTFGDRINRIHADGSTEHVYHMGDGPIDMAFDYVPGDANADWEANVADAVFLISYIFKGGTPPTGPVWRANANGDDGINVGDAVYLINYIFSGGPAPQTGPTWLTGYAEK
jgi:hypothetical protein